MLKNNDLIRPDLIWDKLLLYGIGNHEWTVLLHPRFITLQFAQELVCANAIFISTCCLQENVLSALWQTTSKKLPASEFVLHYGPTEDHANSLLQHDVKVPFPSVHMFWVWELSLALLPINHAKRHTWKTYVYVNRFFPSEAHVITVSVIHVTVQDVKCKNSGTIFIYIYWQH